MKKLLVLLFVSLMLVPFALVAEGQQEAAAPVVTVDPVEEAVMSYFANMPPHIYKIGQADFIAKVAAGDDMVVLDIRQPDVYGEAHVKGRREPPLGNHRHCRSDYLHPPG